MRYTCRYKRFILVACQSCLVFDVILFFPRSSSGKNRHHFFRLIHPFCLAFILTHYSIYFFEHYPNMGKSNNNSQNKNISYISPYIDALRRLSGVRHLRREKLKSKLKIIFNMRSNVLSHLPTIFTKDQSLPGSRRRTAASDTGSGIIVRC